MSEQTRETFQSFYEQQLKPKLETLDGQRATLWSKIKRYRLLGAVFGLIAGLLIGFVVHMSAGEQAFYLIASIFGVVGGVLLGEYRTRDERRAFVQRYKKEIIEPIIHRFNPDFVYEPRKYISRDEFQYSRLFQERISRYSGDDLIRGEHGKTAFKCSEVKAKKKVKKRDSDGKSKTEHRTFFHGLFFIADFNKHFDGFTILRPERGKEGLPSLNFSGDGKKNVSELMGFFSRISVGSWSPSKADVGAEVEAVKLEDPVFEKHFQVYGTDPIEARYILTSSLMERISGFREKSGGNDDIYEAMVSGKMDQDTLANFKHPLIFVSFRDSKMYLAKPFSRELFEPKLSKTLIDPSLVEEYYEDFKLVLDIIDDFNLNTRIWTKE